MSENNNRNREIPQQLEDMYEDLDGLFVCWHDYTVRKMTDFICSCYFDGNVDEEIKSEVANKVVERFDKAISEWYADGSYKDFEY